MSFERQLLAWCFAASLLGTYAMRTCYQCATNNGRCSSDTCKTVGACFKREKNFDNGTWVIYKGCEDRPGGYEDCRYDGIIAQDGVLCYCNTDWCNKGFLNSPTPTVAAVVAISLALVQLLRR